MSVHAARVIPLETASNVPAASRRLRIEEAALRAVVYADLFDAPLTGDELVRYLPYRADRDEVEGCLRAPTGPARQIVAVGPYYCRAGHEHLVEIHRERARAAVRLWRRARAAARLLAAAPFVRMVAVTGALAMDNCRAYDDVDLLLVTTPGRVWVTRRLVLSMSRMMAANTLCPNFVLSEDAMALRHRSFYAARELAQMVPLYGEATYRKMRELNSWTSAYLPNASGPPRPPRFVASGVLIQRAKHVAETGLRLAGLSRLERWELGRLRARAQSHLHDPTVVLDEHQCKAHFIDYPALLLTRYREALESVGLQPL